MSNSRVGFGLLGAGLVAPFHARALQASDTAELIGVADLDAARLAKITGEFGCAGYAGLDAMLADPRIDAVSILTPNHLHFDAVVQAARAGKHVLIEKPPAMSLREVDQMAAACRAAGVKAAVAVQCRARQAVQAIKRAVVAGRFGKICHADAYMKWFRAAEYYHMDAWRMSRRSGAGVTIQQAFHYIDLLQYLVGPPRRVQARMHNLGHPGVELEDTLLAFVEYQNGALGVVQASTALWPGSDIRIEINGEKGTAILVGERMHTWKFRDEQPEDDEIRGFGSAAAATGATGAADLGFHDHQVVIEDLVRAIRTGTEPEITLESVRPTLEWALAMYLSAKRDAAVDLPLQDETEVW
jgi:predicted dehydrogenase